MLIKIPYSYSLDDIVSKNNYLFDSIIFCALWRNYTNLEFSPGHTACSYEHIIFGKTVFSYRSALLQYLFILSFDSSECYFLSDDFVVMELNPV